MRARVGPGRRRASPSGRLDPFFRPAREGAEDVSMSTVCIRETDGNLQETIARVFEPWGGASRILGGRDEILIKVNAVEMKKHCYTPPDLVEALVLYLSSQGGRRIYVMDNCTQGNFTRLVFYATGIAQAARRAGATPVYLDEVPHETMRLRSPRAQGHEDHAERYEQEEVRVPAVVLDKLVRNRSGVFYIDVPKLKTHSMTVVTLGIKNQWGYLAQADRIADHNYLLQRKCVDILEAIKPDFTLIDAREATQFGHYPSEALLDRQLVPYGLLVGGDDVVSVDSVAAGLMGFPWQQVEHIRLAHERGLGKADPADIEIIGSPDRYRKHLSWELFPLFPKDVDVHRGEELCCKEGCATNVLACLQVFSLDFRGRGGFSIVMGKGWDPSRLQRLQRRVLVVGRCAADEIGERIRESRRKDEVAFSYGCNNLRDTITCLLRWMRIPPLRLIPVSPLRSVKLLAAAKWNGSTALIPPLWL